MYRVIDEHKIQNCFLIVSKNERKDRAILAARKAYSNPTTPATLAVQQRSATGKWVTVERLIVNKPQPAEA